MLRAVAILFVASLLGACVTTDARTAAKSEKFRSARAAATSPLLGTSY